MAPPSSNPATMPAESKTTPEQRVASMAAPTPAQERMAHARAVKAERSAAPAPTPKAAAEAPVRQPQADPGQFAPPDLSATPRKYRDRSGNQAKARDLEAAAEAAEDAALSKILKPDDPGDAPQKKRGPAPVKDDADDDSDDENTESANADPAETTPERTPEQQVALTAAIQALKLDEWKQSEIDELSDDDILERGQRAKSRQDRVSRGLERIKQATPEDTAPTNGHAENGKAPAQAESTPESDPFDAAAKVFEKTTGYEELGKPLAEMHRAVLKAYDPLLQGMVSLLQQQEERLVAQSDRLFAREFKEAKAGLEGLFPQIKDPSKAAEFKAKTRELYDSGQYDSVDEAASMAGLIRFGRKALEQAAEQRSASRTKRAQGQPTLGEPVQFQSARVLTPDQQVDRAAQLAAQGKSKRQIRSELGLTR